MWSPARNVSVDITGKVVTDERMITEEKDFEIENFVSRQLVLLRTEHEAEMKEILDMVDATPEECEAQGKSILHLMVKEETLDNMGIIRVTLRPQQAGKELPLTRMKPGGEVILRTMKKPSEGDSLKYVAGVISNVTAEHIELLLDRESDLHDMDDSALRMDLVQSDTTYKSMKSSMEALRKMPSSDPLTIAYSCVKECFDATRKKKVSCRSIRPGVYNQALNESQRSAVEFALTNPYVALIQGPPGTGKTTVVVEIIMKAVLEMDYKVLVSAPSNVAVDNILSRLAAQSMIKNKINMVRIGHPARVSPEVMRYTMSAQLAAHHPATLIRDATKELDGLREKLAKSDVYGRKEIRRSMKSIRREIKRREDNAVKDIMNYANVVFCTTVGAASHYLENQTFSLLIIDEAAQALEASCWIPMLKSLSCILVGDHKQLPPTVKSNASELSKTLFDRLLELYEKDRICVMLREQYRMNRIISDWASNNMYDGILVPAPGIGDRHIPCHDDRISSPMILIDTAGCDMFEEVLENGSKRNEGETLVVEAHIELLVKNHVEPSRIAVITPYNAQVEMLKRHLGPKYEDIEIRSVDGVQGGEMDVVILSMVRSNPQNLLGFLIDNRRLNVAVTRARYHIALVCNSECVSSDAFIKTLIDHIQEYGASRSAIEYVQGGYRANLPSKYPVGGSNSTVTVLSTPTFVKTAKKSKKSRSKSLKTGTEAQKMAQERELNVASDADNVERTSAAISDETVMDMLMTFVDEHKEKDTENKSDSIAELKFPSTLTSRQRKLVHTEAERLRLKHYSSGDDSNRFVVVLMAPTDATSTTVKEEKKKRENSMSNISTRTVETKTKTKMYPPADKPKSDMLASQVEGNIKERTSKSSHMQSSSKNSLDGMNTMLQSLHLERNERLRAQAKDRPPTESEKKPKGKNRASCPQDREKKKAGDDWEAVEKAIQDNQASSSSRPKTTPFPVPASWNTKKNRQEALKLSLRQKIQSAAQQRSHQSKV